MTYVDSHLLPGERVVYRTTLHPIVFGVSAFTAIAGIVLASFKVTREFSLVFVGLFPLVLLLEFIRYKTSEFAVTTTRVVIKVGWLNRRMIELQLSKVESIGIEQDIIGRLFDFGTIQVKGTGGTNEPFTFIRAPLDFRSQVQLEAEKFGAARSTGASSESVPNASAGNERIERECPYCAEKILAKASLCRFCGKAVTPMN